MLCHDVTIQTQGYIAGRVRTPNVSSPPIQSTTSHETVHIFSALFPLALLPILLSILIAQRAMAPSLTKVIYQPERESVAFHVIVELPEVFSFM